MTPFTVPHTDLLEADPALYVQAFVVDAAGGWWNRPKTRLMPPMGWWAANWACVIVAAPVEVEELSVWENSPGVPA